MKPTLHLSLALSLVASAGLDAQTTLQRYEFDAAQSQLYVVTHRSGIFAGVFGHEHVILPGVWSGSFCWSADAPLSAHGVVNVDARSLVIDTDAGRKLAGLGGGPSGGQLRTVQRKFVDQQHLDTARYAQIRIELPAVNKAETDKLQVRGRLTIRDVTRDVAFPLQVIPLAEEAIRVSGILTVRQSEFGIKPESIAGVVKVKDPVDIHFTLLAKPAAGACPLGAAP